MLVALSASARVIWSEQEADKKSGLKAVGSVSNQQNY